MRGRGQLLEQASQQVENAIQCLTGGLMEGRIGEGDGSSALELKVEVETVLELESVIAHYQSVERPFLSACTAFLESMKSLITSEQQPSTEETVRMALDELNKFIKDSNAILNPIIVETECEDNRIQYCIRILDKFIQFI